MSQPILVDLLSDDEDDCFNGKSRISTPISSQPKRPKPDSYQLNPNTIFLIDDDPTPQKPAAFSISPTLSVVPETPFSELYKSEGVNIEKCDARSSNPVKIEKCDARISNSVYVASYSINDHPNPQKPGGALSVSPTTSVVPDTPFSELPKAEGVRIARCTAGGSNPVYAASNSEGISQLICLESDNELEDDSPKRITPPGPNCFNMNLDVQKLDSVPGLAEPSFCSRNEYSLEFPVASPSESLEINDHWVPPSYMEDDYHQHLPHQDLSSDEDVVGLKEPTDAPMTRDTGNGNGVKRKSNDNKAKRSKMTKEERMRLMEEKKSQREKLKLEKAALKAEAAQKKKLEKEAQKWEKGKHAVKSIVAEIDSRVVENGSIGGHLLTRLSEKDITYRIISNPIERSIIWAMNVPEELSELATRGQVIQYLLLVYQAEEFCRVVNSGSLKGHICDAQKRYPSYTVCILTNRLMSHINKREQENYKNPNNTGHWQCPPVEELFAELATQFDKVHSRMCVDEAELAEHVAGLTVSLANCQFRKGLTRLSVNANGAIISKDCVDRNLIKQSPWLKALVAIPKVQPRFAIAIWKKYPSMKILLKVYMDPSKSVHEKEFLLKNLKTEGLLGDDRRVGEVCSKRVYRILMAQNGSIKTDDVEDGADCFTN